MKKFILALIAILIIGAIIYFMKGHNSTAELPQTPKDTLNVSIGGEPATLDPAQIVGAWDFRVVGNIFEGLAVSGPNNTIVPGVAEKWTASNNNTVYDFYLRKNAKWSDGTPVTAHDFEYALKRTLNPKTASNYASLLYLIKGGKAYNEGRISADSVGVKALDDYHLRINLQHPAPYFLQMAAHFSFFPVPEHIVKKYGANWAKDHLVSNGPYYLEEWKPKAYIKITANPYYWDQDNVSVKHAILYTQDDNAALLKRYRANELDILPDLDINNAEWAKKNLPNEFIAFPYSAVNYYLLNLNSPKFKDPRVRLALNLALDRNFITDKILRTPTPTPQYGLVVLQNTDYPQYKPEWADLPLKDRIEKAKTLLKEAGYSSENPLKITIAYPNGLSNKPLSVAIAAMWKEIGVDASLLGREIAVHYADVRAGVYDAAKAGWVADYADPTAFLFMYTSDSTINYPAFKDKRFDEAYKAALNAPTQKEAYQYEAQAEKILMDSNALLSIATYNSMTLLKPWVKGYTPDNLDVHLLKFLKIETR